MRGKINRELRERARNLRVNDRLSAAEISRRLGIPKGTLSGWLKDIPLTQEEKSLLPKGVGGKNKKFRGVPSKFLSMIDVSRLTRHQKAKIAESAVLFRMALYGYTIYGSVFDCDNTDWVIDNNAGKLLKIQVRWAGLRGSAHGLPHISLLKSSGRNKYTRYIEGDFDFIIGYDFYTDSCYIWSFEELIGNKTSVTISEQNLERWDKLLD